MKTSLLLLKIRMLLSFLVLVTFSSCSKDSNVIDYSHKEDKEYHVIYMHWDNFHRTKHDCKKGFGLCNFQSCAFCCTINDVIVNCEDGKTTNGGVVYINQKNNIGYMEILLDPNYQTHLEIIENRETLHIDSDIVSLDGKYFIAQGDYFFNSEIGIKGGYRTKISYNYNY